MRRGSSGGGGSQGSRQSSGWAAKSALELELEQARHLATSATSASPKRRVLPNEKGASARPPQNAAGLFFETLQFAGWHKTYPSVHCITNMKVSGWGLVE